MSNTQVAENGTGTNDVDGKKLFKQLIFVGLAYASFFAMPPVVVFKFVVPYLTPMAEQNIYIIMLSYTFLTVIGVGLSGTFMNKARWIKHDGPPPRA